MRTQKHSSMRPCHSIHPRTPLGTMQAPSRPSGLYCCLVSCILGVGSNLLCDCDDATEVTGVNNEVSGCGLRYNARVVDCVDGRDLGNNGCNGKCWQWGWRTGGGTNGRHSKNNELENGVESEELIPSSSPYIPIQCPTQ
jgi:hypothetical protein